MLWQSAMVAPANSTPGLQMNRQTSHWAQDELHELCLICLVNLSWQSSSPARTLLRMKIRNVDNCAQIKMQRSFISPAVFVCAPGMWRGREVPKQLLDQQNRWMATLFRPRTIIQYQRIPDQVVHLSLQGNTVLSDAWPPCQ